MRRVAVTGLGAVTPLGNDAPSTWQAAVEGRSGVDFIRAFDPNGFPVRIAAEVKDFDPAVVVGGKDARKLDRNVVLAVAAARAAPGSTRRCSGTAPRTTPIIWRSPTPSRSASPR